VLAKLKAHRPTVWLRSSVSHAQIKTWRDASLTDLEAIKSDLSDEYFRRGRHVITEMVVPLLFLSLKLEGENRESARGLCEEQPRGIRQDHGGWA
jgi:hypothetical protein